jgi:hypothetical protein
MPENCRRENFRYGIFYANEAGNRLAIFCSVVDDNDGDQFVSTIGCLRIAAREIGLVKKLLRYFCYGFETEG